MELQKRDCKIKAHIEPLGAELLYVSFDFGDKKLEFTPSSVGVLTDEQFGEFISALYSLYSEKSNGVLTDSHCEWDKRVYHKNENNKTQAETVIIEWDGEGPYIIIEMTRKSKGKIIEIKTSDINGETLDVYKIDGRDFCYAVAKACTEAIKQFGFYGFYYSTEAKPIMLHQLLFIKAYALKNMEARRLTIVDVDYMCCKSDFEKEIELLLFDM